MGRERKLVCRRCGAPRDLSLHDALCRTCYNAREMEKYYKKQGLSMEEVALLRSSADYRRLHGLRQAYARLGLEVGKVRGRKGAA